MAVRRRGTARRVATGGLAAGLTIGGLALALPAPAGAAACAPARPGQAAVRGDVNGDGRADAVVGEPGVRNGAGAVRVLFGTPTGLGASSTSGAPDDQLVAQDTAGVPGDPRAGARFGAALVTADLNSDGCADVAVGSPGESRNRGAVTVLFGSPTGLTGAGALRFVPGSGGVPAVVGRALFGSALAAGDFDGDDRVDLVVGAPDDGLTGAGRERGAIVVLPGSAAGPAAAGARKLSADSADVPTVAEDGDCFGQALATGDFDGDGVDDLAVGAPGEDGRTGGIVVLPGRKGFPLATAAPAALGQGNARVPGSSEPGDLFGAVLAAGDVTGDGRDDLAVGVSGENGGRGAVVLLPGGASGPRGAGGPAWRQGAGGVGGTWRPNHFGLALAIGHLDSDGFADLAVASEDRVDGVELAGAVTYLRGSAAGLTTDGRGGTRLTQPAVSGAAARDARFGRTLTILPVVGTPLESLLVGAPRWTDSSSAPVAGAFFELAPAATGPAAAGARRWTAATAGVQGDPVPYAFLGSALG